MRGKYYYLYLIEDIYSRKTVGWEVHENEDGAKAAVLLQRSVISEQCLREPLVLHSDNGTPMKLATLLSKMYELGITPSRGRPRVSNDNPYSEALFRTLKYCPQWPTKGFGTLDAARCWVRDFIRWYNHEHRHSRIRLSRQQSVIEVRTGKSLPCATNSMSALETRIRSDGQDALATGSRLVPCC